MALNPGELVSGKYKVERLLAEGGMGAVYVAENQVLQKRVAIKVMNEGFAAIPGATERFLREGIAASRVSHPAIVQVFDAGQHEGAPWLAMEFLDGMSLGERIETLGPLALEELLHVCRGVLPALAAVHAQGLIHRDLKPDNIFLAEIAGGAYQPKLLDFGVAKDTRAGVNKLTATGAVVGTASYLAPEQARGAEIDARTDVYAMGAVIYEALSGSLPYEADTLTQLVAKMFTEAPVPLEQVAPHTPAAVCQVVAACLAQHPDQRYAGASELLEALEAAARGIAPQPAQAPMAYASTAIGAAASAPSGVMPPAAASHGAMAGTPSGVNTGVAQMSQVRPQKKRAIWPILAAAFVLGAGGVIGVLSVLSSSSEPPTAANVPAVAAPAPPSTPQAAELPSGATTPAAPSGVGAEPGETGADDPPPTSVDAPSTARRRHTSRHNGSRDGTQAAASTHPPPTATTPVSAPGAAPTTAVSAPGAAPTTATPASPTQPFAAAPLPPGVGRAPRAPLPNGVRSAPAAPGLAATPTPGAHARRHPPRPRTELSAAQIAPVVNQMMPRMQRCYARRVRRVPGLRGVIDVQFTVGANGRVSQANAISNGTDDAWMGRCVVQNVRRMRFPVITNGSPTTVRRTYRFGS